MTAKRKRPRRLEEHAIGRLLKLLRYELLLAGERGAKLAKAAESLQRITAKMEAQAVIDGIEPDVSEAVRLMETAYTAAGPEDHDKALREIVYRIARRLGVD